MHLFTLPIWETGLRLLLAALLGSTVGYERQRKEGSAGLRTHMLVCVGSALIMIVSAFGFEDILGRPDVVLDPSRVAAQVVSGIGFLGAGTILFLRPRVIKGLTTAAGLWSVAAIGLAVGGGLYTAALMTTAIVLIILWLIKPLEARFFHPGKNHSDLTLKCQRNNKGCWEDITALIGGSGLELDQMVIKPDPEGGEDEVVLTFGEHSDQKRLFGLMNGLRGITGVKEIAMGA
jgi:putative Mg2+ transporter-C (MgtC) family protein